MDRIAGKLKATLVLQHHPDDTARLPDFPASAR